MLSAAALAGCTKAETLPEVPGNVLLSVSATIPENLATKSYGDGGTADILYAEAYTHEGTRVLRKECSVENGSASIELQLAKGRSYDIIFWAQCKDCKAYDNSDLREIRLEEQLAIEDFSGAEGMDAFCKVMQDVEVTSSADIAVILERPLAQLNISSSGELSGDARSTALTLEDIPEYYRSHPELLEFLSAQKMPWKESRTLAGEIGRYIVMMRQTSDAYLIGAATDENAREIDIPLDFLPKGTYTANHSQWY